jgi:phosphoglycerate dehydrogenase-like enzyme
MQAQKHMIFTGARNALLDKQALLQRNIPVGFTASTHRLINAQRLAQMKSDAIFINTSCSGLVDEQALASALQTGANGAAAVDVFDVQPVPYQYPLTLAPNLLATPHLGFVCHPVYRYFWDDVHEALTAWLDGKSLPRLV